MLDLLKTHFGYDQFRPGQAEIISHILSGRDALVLMPTGGGKSLCYQLPALKLPGITLVISPLIALMKDQVDGLRANGIAAAFLNSTLSDQESAHIFQDLYRGAIKLLYIAPERLGIASFQAALRSLEVSLIAVDEAHCISEWGHDFRPEYRSLASLRDVFPQTPIVALTATANERVRKDIISQLHLKNGRVYLTSFNRPNLVYRVMPKQHSFEALVRLLEQHKNQPTIIYAFSRKDTESLSADLCLQGLSALPYHAGLDPQTRSATQEKFIRDQVPIIVATIAFGMGIHKPDVRLVVHMDMPKSVEGYYQETGRAGRDGLLSECVLFYSSGDRRKHDFFIDQLTDPIEQERSRAQLKQIMDYCEGLQCRRAYLLSYFGETSSKENCEACDRCLAPAGEKREVSDLARKIIEAVHVTGGFYGLDYVVDVLRGARRQKVLERHHDRLLLYGAAKSTPAEELKYLAQALLVKGLLLKKGDRYPVITFTDQGMAFLNTDEPLEVAFPPHLVAERLSTRAASESTSFDVGLFERLRQLRKRLADESGVPPYIIFGDKTLQEMATYFPQREESLLRITGVGEEKLRRFGKEFIAEIFLYASLHGLSEGAPARPLRVATPKPVRSSDTLQETCQLLKERCPLEQIMQRRGLSLGTIITHLEKLAATQKDLDFSYLVVQDERFYKIKSAFEATKGFILTPVRDRLGETFSYEELRLARLVIQSS